MDMENAPGVGGHGAQTGGLESEPVGERTDVEVNLARGEQTYDVVPVGMSRWAYGWLSSTMPRPHAELGDGADTWRGREQRADVDAE